MLRPSRLQPAGIILLEVVMAMALLVLASGVIVGSMMTCTRAATRLKLHAHAADLTVTLASQMKMGLLPTTSTDGGAFTEPGFSDWTWSTNVQSSNRSDATLENVQFTVHHTPTGLTHSLNELIPIKPLRSPGQSPASQPSGPAGGAQS